MNIHPTRDEFHALAAEFTVVPVYAELPAALETPVPPMESESPSLDRPLLLLEPDLVEGDRPSDPEDLPTSR